MEGGETYYLESNASWKADVNIGGLCNNVPPMGLDVMYSLA
jgi:hypothetical protein